MEVDKSELAAKIKAQGDIVRKLKEEKADKQKVRLVWNKLKKMDR